MFGAVTENGLGDMRLEPTANPADTGDCDGTTGLVSNPKAARLVVPANGPGTDIGRDLKFSASLPGLLVVMTFARLERLGEDDIDGDSA